MRLEHLLTEEERAAKFLSSLPEGDYVLTRWWEGVHWWGKHTCLHVEKKGYNKTSLSLADGTDTCSPGTWYALDFEEGIFTAYYRAILWIHLKWLKGDRYWDSDAERAQANEKLLYTYKLLSRYKNRINGMTLDTPIS